MGYYADSEEIDFTIPADKVADALRAVNNTAWQFRDKTYEDLIDAVEDLTMFEGSEFDEHNGSFSLGWHNDKWLTNTELLLETLAPFADHNSYVRMRGEEGSLFGFRVHLGKLVDQSGTVTWDDDR